jgi:hypothetical protein
VTGPIFMVCSPGIVWGVTEGDGSCFHVLRSWTHFRRYRGRRVSFSCFTLLDSFRAIMRASSPVFMFCSPGLVIDSTDDVRSHFHVLRSRTHFGQKRQRQVPFLFFALPDSFGAISRASSPIFMFCATGLLLGGTEGAGSGCHVLCYQNRLGWYRGRRVQFSSWAVSDSFWAVPRASGLIFMFCAPGLGLGGTEGAGSDCHALRS